jgi:4-hydroxybenzoate polyprenyltransferase
LCFFLSPIALFVILGYSYTKRFTWLCHFILGIGLALAPVGAYLTISGKFDLITIILGCSIFFWVGGFDIIYALQDASFDSSFHLKSIPSRFGINKALTISRVSHILSVLLLAVAIYLMKSQFPAIGLLSWIALLFFMLLLIRQHSLVSESNFSNLNQAFFESNGLASLLFGTLIIIDLFI